MGFVQVHDAPVPGGAHQRERHLQLEAPMDEAARAEESGSDLKLPPLLHRICYTVHHI